MPRKRHQGGDPITERSERGPCEACNLPPMEKKFHWFYSFGSPEKLFAHLAKEGIRTTEEYRRQLAIWYSDCRDVVAAREDDPKRFNEKTDHLRRWSFHASMARTPEEFDRLAEELLSARAANAVKFWTRVWRKHEGGRLSRAEIDEAVAATVPAGIT